MDVQWKNVYVCIAEENVQLKNVYAYTCNVQKWYMYVQRKKIFVSKILYIYVRRENVWKIVCVRTVYNLYILQLCTEDECAFM